jgi:hypothetical protein
MALKGKDVGKLLIAAKLNTSTPAARAKEASGKSDAQVREPFRTGRIERRAKRTSCAVTP